MKNIVRRDSASQHSALLLIAVAFALFIGVTPALAQVHVSMTQEFRFDPQEVVIETDTTVVWTNTATSFPHTATADSFQHRRDGFNSGTLPRRWLEPGDSFEFTFTTAGTYPYHCIPHGSTGMVGTVTVHEPSIASSTKYFFTASPAGAEDKTLVRWSVPKNGQRIGFNVLRSTAWEEEFVQVNDSVIKAESLTNDGEEYRFIDADKGGNTKYLYVLKEVRLDGRDAFRGPAIAR